MDTLTHDRDSRKATSSVCGPTVQRHLLLFENVSEQWLSRGVNTIARRLLDNEFIAKDALLACTFSLLESQPERTPSQLAASGNAGRQSSDCGSCLTASYRLGSKTVKAGSSSASFLTRWLQNLADGFNCGGRLEASSLHVGPLQDGHGEKFNANLIQL